MNDQELIKQNWKSYCAFLIVISVTGYLCSAYGLATPQCIYVLNLGAMLGYMAYIRYAHQQKEEMLYKSWFAKLKTFLYFSFTNFMLPCTGYTLGKLYTTTEIAKTIIHFLFITFVIWILWTSLLYQLILLINKKTNYKITWYNINP